jgi:5-(carboxyamino)imidazole ribonucleotide synthase
MKIGILGAGQLAQMMAKAGQQLGHEFKFLSDDPNSCAAGYGELLCASYDDEQAQNELIQWADVVTYEFENIPLATIERIESQTQLYPSANVLATARDRLIEKSTFRALGIETATFFPVDNLEQLTEAFLSINKTAILKTRTEGYDGKGQVVIKQVDQLADAWQQLAGRPCILEEKVNFSREVSIIAARNADGHIVYYPLTENVHREGILRLSIARVNDAMQLQAQSMVKTLMEHLNYVGVIALELFQVGDQLYANEFAPRVHNTGHWTIEGAITSQFENHLRAISQLPLGETTTSKITAMVNLIGKIPARDLIQSPAVLHDYGKSERENRKVGHITLVNHLDDKAHFIERLKQLLQLVGEEDIAKLVTLDYVSRSN